MAVVVNIEIKPYLKKFLLAKSDNNQEPARFPRKSDYNVMLIRLVTNYNTLTSIPVDDRDNVLEYFRPSRQQLSTESINIVLPTNARKNVLSYNYLSRDSKIEFRKEVRLDFNYEFSRFMYRQLKKGILRTEICEMFKKLYDITEDELKTESLYRYSSRLLEDISSNCQDNNTLNQ